MSGSSNAADLSQRIWHSLASQRGLALQATGDDLDWAGLARRIDRIDQDLSKVGIRIGATVAVLGRNDISSAVAVLTVLATGRCAAIINPFRPAPAILEAALRLSPHAVIVPEGDPVADVATASDPVFVMSAEGSLSAKGCKGSGPAHGEPRSGIVISTSGTTGEPKPFYLSRSVLSRAMPEIEAINVGFGDRRLPDGRWPPLIQYSPLAHIGGVLTLLRAAGQARPSIMLGKFDAEIWAQTVEQWRPFTTGLPPSMMRMVMKAGIDCPRLSSLVSVWSGTAPLRPEDRAAFARKYGLPVLGNYGATEFCGAIAAWSLDDYRFYFSARSGAVGRLDPNIAQVRVRASEGELLHTEGAVGVLEFKLRRIGDCWIETSDLGSVDRDGFLFLHGRKDEHIVRGGFKLSPKTIVDVLRQHPAVRDAAVVGIADERLGQVPVAAVELEDNAMVAPPDLQNYVRERLPAYFVPTEVRTVDHLPRNAAMKLDRRAIGDLFKG